MKHIVVAAKAGAEEPWVADAAAELAAQTGAPVSVVSVDGLELEGLSPLPRSEFAEQARRSAEAMAERLRAAGVEATAEVRPGKVVPGILLYAEEQRRRPDRGRRQHPRAGGAARAGRRAARAGEPLAPPGAGHLGTRRLMSEV